MGNGIQGNYQYFANIFNSDPKVSTIEQFDGVEYDYLLNEGKRLGIGDEYPDDAVFQIHEDSGDLLTDFIDNIDHCVLINSDVKALFETEGVGDEIVEYLPFKLLNKKGKLVSEKSFYIANVLPKVNCLDMNKSKYEVHPKKGTVWRIYEIVIDFVKVDPELKIFRLGEDPKRIILRSDLVDRIKEEGFTGLSLCAMGEELP